MFRSGTTLLARLLNVHPAIVCASDPMRPLVNSFRYDISNERYQNLHKRFDPLDDYFIHNTDLLEKMLQSDLDKSLGCAPCDLLSAVKNRAEDFSGIYSQSMNLSQNLSTYHESVAYLLGLIEKCYGEDRNTRVIAFKEVWSNEFYPALKRNFPDAKCLLILRDPRAIVASKNATGEPYPCAFMGRQWRKLACLSSYLKKHYPEDVLILNYEQLVQNPEESIRVICRLAGVDFVPELLDGSLYKDGWNKEWKQNSSFAISSSQGINPGTIEKWKTLLCREEIATIELFTHDWMQIFGYQPQNSLETLFELEIGSYKRYRNGELAEWIRPFSFDEDNDKLESSIMLEKLRLQGMEKIPTSMKMKLHLPWWQQ